MSGRKKTGAVQFADVIKEQVEQFLPKQATNSNVRDEFKKLRQEEERRLNLLIHNLPEPKLEGDEEDKVSDTKAFLEITKICEIPFNPSHVLSCKRIGIKSEDKTRPVLIKVSSGDMKRQLFRRLNSYKKHQIDNMAPEDDVNKKLISISHDATNDQRTDKKSLAAECDKLNKALDKDSVFLWRVRGPPWDQKKTKIEKTKLNLTTAKPDEGAST